jgi:hypothetical protein
MGSSPQPAKTPAITWQEATAPLRLPLWGRVVRETIAVGLWLFLFVDAFVVDLTTPALASSPLLGDLYRYRFLALMAFLAGSALILPRPKFVVTVGYVLLYPLLVVGWILPKRLFYNWPVVVVFLPAIHSVFANLRTNFAFLTIAVLGATAIVISNQRVLIGGGMVILAAYLIWHFYRRVRAAFAPSTVFANVGGGLRNIWESFKPGMDSNDLSTLDPNSEEYEKALGQNILNRYMFAAVLARVARRLNALHESRQLDLYFVAALAYTFVLTTTVFTLFYIGIQRLVPGSFSYPPTALELVGYSLGAMLHFQLSSVEPNSMATQLITYGQVVSSIVIAVLLAFIIFTSTRERYRKDVAAIAREATESSQKLEKVMLADFDLTVRSAELKILQLNAWLARWCLKSKYGEIEAERIEQELSLLMSGDEPTQTREGQA